jgi:endonuclease/exonuclease/phosphatase family metal-dependent hydrolase
MGRILLTVLILMAMETSAQVRSVKVMTYNIRLDHPVDSINQWPKRDHKVYALIKKYDPDIFGVQEALHHQMEGLRKNLTAYNFVGVGRDDGKTKGEYSAIFFKTDRFKLLEQSTFWLSETSDVPGSISWGAAFTRVATWAKLEDKKKNKVFYILNTHFDHISQDARKQSAELIKTKLASLTGNNPVLVTGDFNCEPTEEPYQVMTSGSTPRLTDSHPKELSQGTFCTFKVNASCRRIDYIFFSFPWEKIDYKIVNDNNGQYYPSDHLPVLGEFILPK